MLLFRGIILEGFVIQSSFIVIKASVSISKVFTFQEVVAQPYQVAQNITYIGRNSLSETNTEQSPRQICCADCLAEGFPSIAHKQHREAVKRSTIIGMKFLTAIYDY